MVPSHSAGMLSGPSFLPPSSMTPGVPGGPFPLPTTMTPGSGFVPQDFALAPFPGIGPQAPPVLPPTAPLSPQVPAVLPPMPPQSPVAPQMTQFPGSDSSALRQAIDERFANAYESQLGYLRSAALDEQGRLEFGIEAYRNMAYAAQHDAADARAKEEAARLALAQGDAASLQMKQNLDAVRTQLVAQSAALTAAKSAAQFEASQMAQAEASGREEISALRQLVSAAAARREQEQARVQELGRELADARRELAEEARMARALRQRTEAAASLTQQARAEASRRDELAVKALREAVSDLEQNFARERAEYLERDRRVAARIHELEHALGQQRLSGSALRQTTVMV